MRGVERQGRSRAARLDDPDIAALSVMTMHGDALAVWRRLQSPIGLGRSRRLLHGTGATDPCQLPLLRISTSRGEGAGGVEINQHSAKGYAEIAAAVAGADLISDAGRFPGERRLLPVERLRVHRVLTLKKKVARFGVLRVGLHRQYASLLLRAQCCFDDSALGCFPVPGGV